MIRTLLVTLCVIASVSSAQGQTREAGVGTGASGVPFVVNANIVQGQAIHCAPGGCISSGPLCDTTAIPGQCMFPASGDPVSACAATPGCVAVTCNSTNDECYARSVTDLTPWAGFYSMIPGPSSTVTQSGAASEFSDLRLKTSIERVGTTVHSLPLYRFNYIDREGRFEGVMAQDVMGVLPEAVSISGNGYYLIDYGMLGTRMRRVD